MKTEDLQSKGLTEEQIKYVMAENGKDIANEQKKTEAAAAERDNLKQQLDTANELVKSFDGMKPEEIKSRMSDYENQIKTMKEDFAKQIETRDFAQALEKELEGYKFTSALAKRAVMDEIKASGLKLSDGKILGLADKVKEIREKNQDAFAAEEGTQKPSFTNPAKKPASNENADVNSIRKAMGLKPIEEK